MPLGYLGTMIGSSIILNQPEHQDQPGMESAVDCDDSHHPSCWKDWQASFHRFTRQDTSLCLGCNPPSPLWVLKAWQVNSASCHPPFYPTPQPLADAPCKGQFGGGHEKETAVEEGAQIPKIQPPWWIVPCIWGFLHDNRQMCYMQYGWTTKKGLAANKTLLKQAFRREEGILWSQRSTS